MQLKIGGYSVTSAMADGEVIKSKRWNVGGYDWEVQVLPNKNFSNSAYVALNLYLHSEVPKNSVVNAKFSCRFIDPTGKLNPTQETAVSCKISSQGEGIYCVLLMTRSALQASGYVKDDSFVIECTLTVLKELAATHRPVHDLVPSSGLHHHLGELLRTGTGADVTFLVSGESFSAHKAILASRSPVFLAEFFGHMEERSQRVEIKDMEAAVFGSMLRFIYTDAAPALDRPEDGMAIAQHLLVAADRYGIDRLKLICEDKLYDSVSVDTAAATLALAEQHSCSHLKSKCLELISANPDAVMASERYKNLTASWPSVLVSDLLKAVRGRKN